MRLCGDAAAFHPATVPRFMGKAGLIVRFPRKVRLRLFQSIFIRPVVSQKKRSFFCETTGRMTLCCPAQKEKHARTLFDVRACSRVKERGKGSCLLPGQGEAGRYMKGGKTALVFS